MKTLDQLAKEKIGEAKLEHDLASAAAAAPLPGPLSDAFSVKPDIDVGPYKVRPFYDGDFDYLVMLKHPLLTVIQEAMRGGKFKSLEPENIRGQHGWNLSFLFTNTPDACEELLKQGVPAYEQAAKKKFSQSGYAALTALTTTVVKQLSVYFSAGMSYGDKPKEGEKSSRQNPS